MMQSTAIERACGAERRAEPRYSLVEPAVVEIPSWAELVSLYTKDISCGGMFVATHSPPERDSRVAVRLVLPRGAGTLEFVGLVVHVVTAAQAAAHGWTAGFGLQFTDLTLERRRALRQLVEQAREMAVASPTTQAQARVRLALAEAAVPPTPPAMPASPRHEAREGVVAPLRPRSELELRSEEIAARLKRRVSKAAAAPGPGGRGLVDEALQLVAEKRYGAAIERLELELQRSPSTRLRVLSFVVQARLALTERDISRAHACYESVLALDPGNEVAERELLMLTAMHRRPPA